LFRSLYKQRKIPGPSITIYCSEVYINRGKSRDPVSPYIVQKFI
jgi:hypothetical protein